MRAYYQMLKSNFFSVKLQSYRSIILSFIGHLTFIFIQTKQNDRTRRPPRNHFRIITTKKKLYQKSKSNEHKNHVSQRNSCFSLLKEGLGSSINDIFFISRKFEHVSHTCLSFFFLNFFHCYSTTEPAFVGCIFKWSVRLYLILISFKWDHSNLNCESESREIGLWSQKNPRNALSEWKVIINQLTSQCSFRRHCLRSLNKNPRTLGTACGVKLSEPQAL